MVVVAVASQLAEPVSKSSKAEVDARIRRAFALHFDLIWRTVRRLGLSGAEADDGAQEVFVVYSKKVREIDPSKERSFLFGTAIRVAANARRARAARPGAAQPGDAAVDELRDPALAPDEQLDVARSRALLDEALASLPDELRVVLVLSELDEITAPVIAEMLAVPVGTVASRLRRAREQFSKVAYRLKTRLEVHP
jgi:RNA polymerase sigma-70 factor (ECF subfamily)